MVNQEVERRVLLVLVRALPEDAVTMLISRVSPMLFVPVCCCSAVAAVETN